MDRKRVTGMYRNVNFAKNGIEYERAYRSSNAEFIRLEKEVRRPYKRRTEWWETRYPKKMPGAYRPRMSGGCNAPDLWNLVLEPQRLLRRKETYIR
jgi:hypothetical protein